MGENYNWLAVRTCPVHKSQLVYIGKFKLGCTGKVGHGSTRVGCPHTEYITVANPKYVKPKELVFIVDRLKAKLGKRDYSEEYYSS